MHEPPRFVRDAGAAEPIYPRLKLMTCPHCRATNCLIRNGRLMGCDPRRYGNASLQRGQRLVCSRRKRHPGCGRSSAIYFKDVLPRFTLRAGLLVSFLTQVLATARVHSGWSSSVRGFSLSSAYRWWRRLGLEQPRLRPLLHGLCPPPTCASPEPRNQLWKHLQEAFPGDPVAGFQIRFQRAFFG